MKQKIIVLIFLVGTLNVVPAAEETISRKNIRDVKRESLYYRVKKTFNISFYKRHFESDPEKYELLNYLVDSGEVFDVSPMAILGAIMAEHSMNQRSQLKQKGEAGINFLGQKFGETGENLANNLNVYFRSASGEATFGPGQIQPNVAKAMQSRIKKKRPDADETELDKYTWKGAINIIAAFMDYAAEEYERAGYEDMESLRQDYAVLATLLNIGETRMSFYDRAIATQKMMDAGEREGPWVNYFGYWIHRNEKILSSKLDKLNETPRQSGVALLRSSAE